MPITEDAQKILGKFKTFVMPTPEIISAVLPLKNHLRFGVFCAGRRPLYHFLFSAVDRIMPAQDLS